MIDRRDELVHALREACEIEHGLMIQYLFTALTMKRRLDEGLTPSQQVTSRRWMAMILGVAREEMGHFATVCNLLSSIGAPPHFGRPNLPRKTGYYPFPFDLQPFGDNAFYRFLVFELPEGFPLPPPPGADLSGTKVIATEAFTGSPIPDLLEYVYVGELYRKIREGFGSIAERELFIGPVSGQTNPREWDDMGMRPVTSRAEAKAAIDWIIEQGEGTPSQREGSHYDRFHDARKVYFDSGRYAASRTVPVNPATRLHRDQDGPVALIENKDSLFAVETFNAVYALTLQLLEHAFSLAPGVEMGRPEQVAQWRQALQKASHQLMSIGIRTLGEWVSELPFGDTADPRRAGATFEIYDDLDLPVYEDARWTFLFETFDRCIAACHQLGQAAERPRQAAISLAVIRRNLHIARHGRP
jgi:hypothetical protein